MTRDDARTVLRRHQSALNRRDTVALAAMYAPDAVLVSPMFATVRGREAIGQSFERLFTIFPDYTLELRDSLFLTDGNRAAEFGVVSATHSVDLFGLPPTGQRIQYQAARVFQLDRGLITYEQRLYDFGGVLERLEKTRLDREMALATAVQHALCRTRHGGAFFEAVGSSLPCRAVGGDFLEYLTLPDGRLGVALGDVSGKGPAAALVAAMLQGMVSMAAVDASSPSAALERLNDAVCRRGIEPRFATLAYGTLDDQGRFIYSNAGHQPPVLVSADGVDRLTEGGSLLGAFEDGRFPEGRVQLARGDLLVFFSDGVTDAVAPDGDDFGMDRLLAVAKAHRGATPAELLRSLLATVEDFCGAVPPTDDVTVAVVQYLGPRSR